jgi:hypothetical protein
MKKNKKRKKRKQKNLFKYLCHKIIKSTANYTVRYLLPSADRFNCREFASIGGQRLSSREVKSIFRPLKTRSLFLLYGIISLQDGRTCVTEEVDDDDDDDDDDDSEFDISSTLFKPRKSCARSLSRSRSTKRMISSLKKSCKVVLTASESNREEGEHADCNMSIAV